jgi:hypothetical protein
VSCPGVVVVWGGDKPCLDVHRIPQGGLVLGGDGSHAHISVVNGFAVVIDQNSRNGTYVNGHHLGSGDHVEGPSLPAVVRTGHTVSVIVADVGPYEGATLSRRGSLVCAGSLATACTVLDRTARAEEHLAILGPLSIGRALAHNYADIVGGERVVANLDVVQLVSLADRLKNSAPRTMILELSRPLTRPDQPELEAWLETDVRIVSIARGMDSFKFMPKDLTARLCYRGVELPQYRFDELPTTIFDKTKAHASFIASALVHLKRMNEETLMRYVEGAIKQHVGQVLRDTHLNEYIAADRAGRDCIVGR